MSTHPSKKWKKQWALPPLQLPKIRITPKPPVKRSIKIAKWGESIVSIWTEGAGSTVTSTKCDIADYAYQLGRLWSYSSLRITDYIIPGISNLSCRGINKFFYCFLLYSRYASFQLNSLFSVITGRYSSSRSTIIPLLLNKLLINKSHNYF